MINPWIYDFAAFDFWIKPLGLLYLAAILKKNGCRVTLINCLYRHHEGMEKLGLVKDKRYGTGHFHKEIVEKPEVLKSVPRKYGRYGITEEIFLNDINRTEEPDVILLSSGMTYWYPGVKKVSEIVREKFRGKPVIFGGIYPTLLPEHAKNHINADAIVTGEAEAKILSIVEKHTGYCFDDSTDYSDLNNVPFPAYELEKKLQAILLLTSRGCPYRCTFCGSYLVSGKFRQRDSQSVKEEIAYHWEKYGLKDFVFFDDALLFKKEKHIYPVLEFVLEKKLRLRFHTPNGIHPNEIDKTAAKLMYESGFKTLRLSLETVNPKRYSDMSYKVNSEGFENAVNNLESAGFKRKNIESYVIMALPEQEPREVIDTIIFAASLGVKVRLCAYAPIPGTPEWRKAVTKGELNEAADILQMNNTVHPLIAKNFGYDVYNEIKKFSLVCNYAVEQELDLIKHLKKSDYLKEMRKYR